LSNVAPAKPLLATQVRIASTILAALSDGSSLDEARAVSEERGVRAASIAAIVFRARTRPRPRAGPTA
jgi:hypothetical protein